DRVYRGYFIGLAIAAVIGAVATAVLVFGAEPLFALFIPEAEAVAQGVIYLRILSVSQLWMAIEIVTAGAFIGQGQTSPPAVIGVVFNVLRIPGALLLSRTSLGLSGVWWAISISSVLKGLVLAAWYLRSLRSNPKVMSLRSEFARGESN
ncbi:MAG TPA: MATE family efflux transporter, partial [Firmicutes bacterium]|nr:MATE family efflux transporter [Bacillota bacterium]